MPDFNQTLSIMKKLKFAFAGLAVFTAVTTMSFTMKEDKAKTADSVNDCWSLEENVGIPALLDRSTTEDCTGQNGICCYDINHTPYGFPSL